MLYGHQDKSSTMYCIEVIQDHLHERIYINKYEIQCALSFS